MRILDCVFVGQKYAYFGSGEQTFREFIAERLVLNLPALAEKLNIDQVNLKEIISALRKFYKRNAVDSTLWLKNMNIPGHEKHGF
jgi:hypothetical protein